MNDIVLVSFLAIYTFSVWGTSLLPWWDRCVSEMDKPKIRELRNRPEDQWCLVFPFGAFNEEKLLMFIQAENQ